MATKRGTEGDADGRLRARWKTSSPPGKGMEGETLSAGRQRARADRVWKGLSQGFRQSRMYRLPPSHLPCCPPPLAPSSAPHDTGAPMPFSDGAALHTRRACRMPVAYSPQQTAIRAASYGMAAQIARLPRARLALYGATRGCSFSGPRALMGAGGMDGCPSARRKPWRHHGAHGPPNTQCLRHRNSVAPTPPAWAILRLASTAGFR